MTQSLYATSWYRVADLRPRLRSHTQIHRHLYRDEIWYVLQDHASGRFHRFTPEANLIIGLMDGQRTVQDIWALAMSRLGNDTPPQDEVIKLLSDLHRADVLQTDTALDVAEMHQRRKAHRKMRLKQYLGNPLSMRIPLVDPDRWLERLRPWFLPLFGWVGALLWLLVVGMGITLAAMHWRALSSGTLDHVFSAENLLLMWLIFPVVKTLHELGHAICAKAGGGEVHEMGVMLLLLMPIPYVDASSASAFQDKRWRLLTGFAGMGVELFLAGLAMLAWVYLEPGLPRAVAYNVILLAGASAVVFNGNPLLRYDGYYMLADALEIPNLAQRANDYWGYLFKRFVLGLSDLDAPLMARGERGWFLFYGVASLAYRSWITFTIVFMVAGRFFFIGVLLALWSLWAMAVMPLGMQVARLAAASNEQPVSARWRSRWGVAAFVGVLVLVLGFVPLPSSTSAEGVMWAPERTQVRTTVDSFVTRVVAIPGAKVHKGDALIECDDPELRAHLLRTQAELAEVEARADAARVSSRVESGILQDQIVHLRTAYEIMARRLDELTLRAPVDGVFVIQSPADLPGHFVPRGELVADVLDAAATVRVVVQQDAAERVRSGTQGVQIRPVERVAEVMSARIVRQVPAATDELPSMALSLQGGGQIGLDPNHPGDSRSIDKLFIIDLELPPAARGSGLGTRLGSRVFVRFEHEAEPLALQAWRVLRRLFLRKFNV
jgi:putative peptide zinc metalloprotease protein